MANKFTGINRHSTKLESIGKVSKSTFSNRKSGIDSQSKSNKKAAAVTANKANFSATPYKSDLMKSGSDLDVDYLKAVTASTNFKHSKLIKEHSKTQISRFASK